MAEYGISQRLLLLGRKAWHYVEVRRNVVHIFLKKTRAGQVDVALYGTVVKSGWGEVSFLSGLL